MRVVTRAEVDQALTFPALVEALHEAFRGETIVPVRNHYEVERLGADATLLVMPAWTGAAATEGFLGVKVVSVFPDNRLKDLPSVQGTFLLIAGSTGVPLAAIEGSHLTLWRTAAASALAARFLAAEDASRMVMVGAGALSKFLVRAHVSQRPIHQVQVWNHRPERAQEVASDLASEGLPVAAVADLEAAVREADLVSCATLATEPVVKGSWLKRGAHLDLVGAFNLRMREADEEAVRRSVVFIDTPAAMTEGGDVALSIKAGTIAETDIRGTLADLCRGRVKGRQGAGEITLFKSVGTAIEDLAAAMLVWRGAAG
jgi:ornithine cyclodeaminase